MMFTSLTVQNIVSSVVFFACLVAFTSLTAQVQNNINEGAVFRLKELNQNRTENRTELVRVNFTSETSSEQQNQVEIPHQPTVKEASAETLVEHTSRKFWQAVSRFKYTRPLSKENDYIKDFPLDRDLVNRLQTGTLTSEEASVFRGKRIVVLGDSVDAFFLGELLTCPRVGASFARAKKKGISCSFLSPRPPERNMNYFMLGRFAKYNFEIVLHRAFYGIEPEQPMPLVNHKTYNRGSRIFKAASKNECYKIILEDTLTYLPEKHRSDLLVFNVNLWVRLKDATRNTRTSEKDLNEGLATFFKVGKEFFKPKAVMVHTVPATRRFNSSEYVNSVIRQVALEKDIGLFDWYDMTSNLDYKEKLRDDRHPSQILSLEAGMLFTNWVYHSLKVQSPDEP